MGDYQFRNLINYPTRSTPLSSFKKKLVILDFWSTSCLSCIDAWPKLLKLQEQFNDKIQIILVNTDQGESTVRNMFEKRKKLAGVDVTLPTVCGDSTLSTIFPRMGLPHVAWVDSMHIVRSITYGSSLSAYNIDRMLINPLSVMRQKQTQPTTFEWSADKPMFIDGNGGNGENLIYHSVLSTHVQGLLYNCSIRGNPKTGQYVKVVGTNVSRARLYALAYSFDKRSDGLPMEAFPNRVLFQDKGTQEQFSGYIHGDESVQDLFCYELQSDSSSAGELFQLMQNDLRRFFHHRVLVKKKRVSVYALSIVDPSKVTIPSDRLFAQGITASQFKVNGGYTMYEVTRALRDLYMLSPHPVLDETNYSGRLYNIDLEVNTVDPLALNNALAAYGLAFKLVKRKIPMIIVSDPVRKVGQSN